MKCVPIRSSEAVIAETHASSAAIAIAEPDNSVETIVMAAKRVSGAIMTVMRTDAIASRDAQQTSNKDGIRVTQHAVIASRRVATDVLKDRRFAVIARLPAAIMSIVNVVRPVASNKSGAVTPTEVAAGA